MVMVPEFQVNPGQVPGAPAPAQANPGVFGMVGEAQAESGAQSANAMAEWNNRYQEARHAMDGATRVAQFAKASGDLAQSLSTQPLQDPVTGLPSRDRTYAAYNDSIGSFKQQAVVGITNPIEQAQVTAQVEQQAIVHGHAVQDAAFRLESSGQRGQLDNLREQYATQAAASASPEGRALAIDNYTAANRAATAGGYQAPEEEARNALLFKSRIAEVGIRAQLDAALDPDSRDPDAVTRLARAVQDPANYPDLLPENRVQLGQHLEATAYRLQIQEASRQQHADMMAERQLRQSQAANFAQDFSAALQGKVDPAAVAENVRLQRYTPEAANAILSARQGRDDPMATARLWQKVGEGTALPDDVYGALKSGQVSGPTGADMIKVVASGNRHLDDAVERGAFSQLKTAVGGDAVEKGLLDMGNAAHVHQVLSWAQAQGEWNNRVTLAGEDPRAVVADMIPRYQPPTNPPASWPRPRAGGIQSSADVADVWAKTSAAHAAGQLSDADFQAQATLIRQYKNFYADQAGRAAAAKGAAAGSSNRAPGAPAQAAKSQGATLQGIDTP